jgi:hypothetical protein
MGTRSRSSDGTRCAPLAAGQLAQDVRDFLLAYCACFVALQTFLM